MNHLKKITLFGILLCLVTSFLIFRTQEAAISKGFQSNIISETDIDRVEWKTNRFPNHGFELWHDDTSPEGVSSSFTTEDYAYFNSNPLYVNEGARSFVIQARADNPVDYSEALLRTSGWQSKVNPTNLTMKFDWFIDELPSAIDNNYLRLRVRFAAPGEKNLYYYFESQNTLLSNNSWDCYFQVSGALQSWNVFDRNLTEDYFEAFSSYPTYQYYTFEFQLRTFTTSYCRAYFDDLWLVNGTTFIGGSVSNGNFETNGVWQTNLNSDQGLISKSTTRQEGEYSLNATVTSNGNQSYARFYNYNEFRASPLNPDQFSLKWRIDELVSPSINTYAYFRVYCTNGTEGGEFSLTYGLFYIGDSVPYQLYGGQDLLATGFNVTNQWHTFETSFWNDVISVNATDFIVISDIQFEVYSRDPGARITILFDDPSITTAALCDMDYEDQNQVGDEIWTWNLNDYPAPNYTVTDNAHSGSRAARLALENGEYFDGYQYLDLYQVNDETDLWLDLFWRIEDWSQDVDNVLYFEVHFEEQTLAYILANNSAVPGANGFDEYIIVSGHNSQGVWNNLMRNLYNDYEDAFGVSPDTTVYGISLHGEADSSGNIEVLFDDVYLYHDPAPEISGIFFTPAVPDTDVNVTAQVYDPSLESVKLQYRIDGGTWNELTMINTGDGFNATIPGQLNGTEVDFYVEATDAFGQVSQSSQVGFTVTSDQEPPPQDLFPLLVGIVVIAAMGVLILAYIFVIRPKQST
ncbi:MAG: hypothetical protein ACFFEE_04885 [Candidatus Thorarchaeota archaeon]